jgi:PHD/YefM family antitoxin component YafN of YafNO toxin-antitoxin module
MKHMATGKDTLSLTDFKRKSADAIKQLRKNGEPLVLTVNGEAQLIVQDVQAYQQLVDALDRAETIAGIRRGLEEAERGETMPIEQAFEELRRKHGLPR